MNFFKTTTTSLFSLILIILLFTGCGFADDDKTVNKEVIQIGKKNDKKPQTALTTNCPAQSMINFFKQKGEILETKESMIGTYSDKEVEMTTIFRSCMPQTISIRSKISKASGFYMYADGILVTYDSIDPQGNHIHQYVENVQSSTKLPKYIITDFNKIPS